MGKQKSPKKGKNRKGRKSPGRLKKPRNKGGKRPSESRQGTPLPEINFSNFVFSLSTSVLIQLGEIPDPITKESNKDFSAAKQTIDILGMLQEKTKGNLTSDEESLIESILYDLRMRFVKAKG